MTPREKELQGILLEMAEALRGKARVAANDHVSGNRTDPVAILKQAADELQLAAGASLSTGTMTWPQTIFDVETLSLVLGDQLQAWSSEERAARVRLELNQDQAVVHCPRSNQVISSRGLGLHLSINIEPDPKASHSTGEQHADSKLH